MKEFTKYETIKMQITRNVLLWSCVKPDRDFLWTLSHIITEIPVSF